MRCENCGKEFEMYTTVHSLCRDCMLQIQSDTALARNELLAEQDKIEENSSNKNLKEK